MGTIQRVVLWVMLVGYAGFAVGQDKVDYDSQGRTTKDVAEQYFRAYMDKDWDTLEALLAEDARFEDPTATRLFRASAKVGRSEILRAFREHYGPITFQFMPRQQLLTIDHAVFLGDLTWTYQHPQREMVVEKMPLMVVVGVANGKVVSHLDYADYRPYFAAETAARAAATPPAE